MEEARIFGRTAALAIKKLKPSTLTSAMRCRFFASVCLGLALAYSISAARAASIEAHYTTYFLGLPVSSSGLVIDSDAKTYRIKGTGKASLLADLFKPLKAQLLASGTLSAGRAVPQHFTAFISGSDAPYDIAIERRGGKMTSEKSLPLREKPYPDDFVPVTPAMKDGALDPLSAFVIAVPPGQFEQACAKPLKIYTGRERFDILLHYTKREAQDMPGVSAGPAVVCAARYHPVGGHRAKKSEIQYMESNDEIEGWFLPLSDQTTMLLSKVRIATKLGPVTVELEKAKLLTPAETAKAFTP